MRQQASAIAGLGHCGNQVFLFEAEQPVGDSRRIGDHAAAVLGPNRIAQRAGGKDVLVSSLIECAAANQQQMNWVFPLNKVRQSG